MRQGQVLLPLGRTESRLKPVHGGSRLFRNRKVAAGWARAVRLGSCRGGYQARQGTG